MLTLEKTFLPHALPGEPQSMGWQRAWHDWVHITQKHTYALPIPINRKKASQNFSAGRLWRLHLKIALPICVHLHSSDEELLQNNYMQKCGWYKQSHLVGLYYKNNSVSPKIH